MSHSIEPLHWHYWVWISSLKMVPSRKLQKSSMIKTWTCVCWAECDFRVVPVILSLSFQQGNANARRTQTKSIKQWMNKCFISYWIHMSVVIFSRRHRRAMQMSWPMTRVFINMYVDNGPKNKNLSPLFFLSCPSGPLITHNPSPQCSECAECFKQVHLFWFNAP